MKINKLFHWLYGALMCLPLLGVLFTSLYVTFNPNAKDSSSITTEYYEKVDYSTNEVDSYDDLVIDNIYQLNFFCDDFGGIAWSDSPFLEDYFDIGFLYYYYSDSYYWVYTFDEILDPFYGNGNNLVSCSISARDDFINLYLFNGDNYFDIFMEPSSYNGNTFYCGFKWSQDLKFLFDNGSDLDREYFCYFLSEADLTKCISQYEIKEVENLDNAFTYAINDINNNPLYNWAQNSFLVAPIAFVTGLFGLTQTSPVVTLLSYWLTISIVWLVFDLIMYIPLLVHRWLDKGVLS